MLTRLEIENYGLIARGAIEFSSGATIFTGETGSGKTMILGALDFVLGERASSDVVRRGAGRATVTLTFEPGSQLRARLTDDGYPLDPGEDATIVREMSDAGKSSVRIGGRIATASYVREIRAHIAEMVGQHEAQHLLAPAYQLELLDRFGGAKAIAARDAVEAARRRAEACAQELRALHGDERRAQERYEDARFALEEIEGLAPQAGEDERLSVRRRYLENVERIAHALRTAHEALGGDDGSAADALGMASSALAGIADISSDLQAMADAAAALQSETSELATRLARALEATEFDPSELETINARLDVLDRLKRKYGGTIEAVCATAAASRAVVETFDSRDERLAHLTAASREAEAELAAGEARLRTVREEAAARLKSAVTKEFSALALGSGRFEVSFDPIEFAFAANKGEPLRPLARLASGGELSRVLLALVVVLAGARERTALIFDEIDTGIGGQTATAVGVRIGRLAQEGQVICVTHLAQLATWSDRHYVLEKQEKPGGTTIAVREISDEEERAAELARMLSGESHEVALEHARMLLRAR
ncbi:MAG TPA: DNA repair protein RecN [Candidatus Baltobacteraceae bacterium]|nr:DNA repair protein RecN [Candidatus Baltobacteraceae bacterium]